MVGNRLCDLTLNRKHIRKIAVISLCPQLSVGACIEQLRVDAHAIARTLDTSFHDMRDPELLADLAQIARHVALVLHHRRAADYFQIGDRGQVGQNFVLDAVGEISVLFLVAQVSKWKNGDTLPGNRRHSSSNSLGRSLRDRRRTSTGKD